MDQSGVAPGGGVRVKGKGAESLVGCVQKVDVESVWDAGRGGR